MTNFKHLKKLLVGLLIIPYVAGAERIATDRENEYTAPAKKAVSTELVEQLLNGEAQTRASATQAMSAPAKKAAKSGGGSGVVIPISGYSRGQVQGDNAPTCRRHPILKRHKTHAGCDMATGRGRAVVATMAGKVVSATKQRGYGNIITIAHKLPGGQVVYSRYAHLHVGKGCKMISPGTRVSAGTKIGCVGNTGLSSGPHLHFEIRGSAGGGAVYDSKHFILSGGKLRKAKTC